MGWPETLIPCGAALHLGLDGFLLWAWYVWLFARGTLAPWAPRASAH